MIIKVVSLYKRDEKAVNLQEQNCNIDKKVINLQK